MNSEKSMRIFSNYRCRTGPKRDHLYMPLGNFVSEPWTEIEREYQYSTMPPRFLQLHMQKQQ